MGNPSTNQNTDDIDSSTGTTARLNIPYGMATTTSYMYFVTSHRITTYNWATTEVLLYSGTGVGGYTTNCKVDVAQYMNPMYIAIYGNNNNLYVAERDGNCVKKINILGALVTTWVPTLALAQGITVYKGIGYVVSYTGSAVYRFSLVTGEYVVALGNTSTTGRSNTAGAERFSSLWSLTADCARKSIFLADRGNKLVRRYYVAKNTLVDVVGTGSSAYNGPGPVTATSYGIDAPTCARSSGKDGNELFVCDYTNNRIHTVGLENTYLAGVCEWSNSPSNTRTSDFSLVVTHTVTNEQSLTSSPTLEHTVRTASGTLFGGVDSMTLTETLTESFQRTVSVETRTLEDTVDITPSRSKTKTSTWDDSLE
eukprot:PhF_6_TR37534/c0_g1_i3/m.55564